MKAWKALMALFLTLISITIAVEGQADGPLSVDQLVEIAIEVNPKVRATRARWESAEHSIKQNLAPAEPVFGFSNLDSPTNGISEAATHSLTITESLQFPGKALLQTRVARRTARIAELTFEAAIRDIRAAVEAACYQLLLDEALLDVATENVANLDRVLKVTEVAYSANRVTQTDFISAEFDLASARQQEMQLRTAEANDRTTLNQLLSRPPDEPLGVEQRLEFKPVSAALENLIERAFHLRLEILQAALAERNTDTARELARLEYLPDYQLEYIFDNYLVPSAGPSTNALQDHGFTIGFTMPLFFWLKQNEDVKRAGFDLEAAGQDLRTITDQTAAAVTTLYRNARLAHQTVLLYRNSLIPLARQDFLVALTAYQAAKIDFVALISALSRMRNANVTYLQAGNALLASRVAIEQTVGEPLRE